MLGLGGGVLMILFLILGLGTPVRQAVALSLLAVIASSCMGGSVYIRELTNLRLGLALEIFSVTGAVAGAYIAFMLPGTAIEVLLAAVLLYVSFMTFRRRRIADYTIQKERHSIEGEYFDKIANCTVRYCAVRVRAGMAASVVAGLVSGVVGIGGGVVKVPIMNYLMKVPVKVAAATSNFMVGITAAASALIYFNKGAVDLAMAVPVVTGVFIGAYIGIRLLGRTEQSRVRSLLSIVLGIFAVLLLMEAGGLITW